VKKALEGQSLPFLQQKMSTEDNAPPIPLEKFTLELEAHNLEVVLLLPGTITLLFPFALLL
jgi:hypothetical protein